jgi:hypothetical protein
MFPKIKEIRLILILERHYISSQYPVTDLGKWKHVFLTAKVISRTSELGPRKQTHKEEGKKEIQGRLSLKK